MPGGGAPPPYPPYDPKTQWRAYGEQQRAYWRSQRDAWKAQQHAWKAHYAHTYGPRVPSLVGPLLLVAIGVVGLLLYTGQIPAGTFWTWYGHWWPVLLIGAGVLLLGEWALDLRRPSPVRRGGHFVGLIVLLAILGALASGWHGTHPWFDWNNGNNDFFNFNSFGQPEHDFDQAAISQSIPAKAAIEIENPRGDVSVAAGEGAQISVQAHEVAYASSEDEAKKIYDAEAAAVTVTGNAVLVKSQGNSNGRVDLTITVPPDAQVKVNAERGDVTAAGLGAGISLSAAHGDTRLNGITGPVVVHFANGKHDFSAHQVSGDLTADGDTNDVTLSNITGRIAMNGEIFGDVHMEAVAGPVKVHTSITDLDVASLPGDLTLDSDNLRVTQAKGSVRVQTHSKDVDLSQIYGDTSVQNRDGSIAVEPAGAYAVEAKNSKGDVEITMPPEASATLAGHVHNGDIVTEYGFAVSGEQDKSVSGRIGAGAARIALDTSDGDVRIKKGPSFGSLATSVPAVPVPPTPKAPNAPGVPHLKSGSQAPREVTQ
jgi:DUF4097 and DUF4098 domain-containing protein YvlB